MIGVLVGAAAGCGACEKKGDSGGGGAGGKPRATGWVEPLPVGSITYFNAQCVSCHGEYGTQIIDHNIAKVSNAVEYRGMVQYMVTDRASSKLPERELDAVTAYCVSLAAGGEGVKSEGPPLFVCVISPVNKGGLEGEVTPGSTVTLITGKGQVRVNAEVSRHGWTITPVQLNGAKQSAGDDWVNATIEAPKGATFRC
ncbi:MAG: hypothetical protein QM783_01980 [Phycisphaerales bacterium]